MHPTQLLLSTPFPKSDLLNSTYFRGHGCDELQSILYSKYGMVAIATVLLGLMSFLGVGSLSPREQQVTNLAYGSSGTKST